MKLSSKWVLSSVLLVLTSCKTNSSQSSNKEIDSIQNAGKVKGKTAWTIKCAAGFVNEDGTDRALVTTLDDDLDSKYCNKDMRNGGGVITPIPNPPPPPVTPPTDELSFARCESAPAEVKSLTVIVQPGAVSDIDELCVAFADSFGKILKVANPIYKYLKESRSTPAKVIVSAAGTKIEYKENLHRLMVPWDFGPKNYGDLTSALAAANVSIDGLFRDFNGQVTQVLYKGMWRDVCDDGYDNGAALLVCKVQGKTLAPNGIRGSATTTGVGMALRVFKCPDTAKWITDCTHEWGDEGCFDGNTEGLYVKCQ